MESAFQNLAVNSKIRDLGMKVNVDQAAHNKHIHKLIQITEL